MKTSGPSRVVHARCIRGGRRRTLCSYGLSRESFDSVIFLGFFIFHVFEDFGKVIGGDFIYFGLLDVFY